jgi:signal transduction histidine kinase/DNA-binding response OmpR family regulator
LDGHTQVDAKSNLAASDALLGLIGIEAVKQSARLATLCGGVLALLVGVLAWQGTATNGLDSRWLGFAGVLAILAAFGGLAMSGRLLSRRSLLGWRLLQSLVMTLNGVAWLFAAIVAVKVQPMLVVTLVIAALAQSLSLLPMLSWLPGLLLQLITQLLLVAGFAYYADSPLHVYLLPLGIWAPLGLLALMGAVYARRVDMSKGDIHYMRVETAELQDQVSEISAQLRSADEQRATLEGELAEILNLAEDANRAKTEFLATMSHEIRTPLNGILPILEMMRDTRLDNEQLKLVRTAQSSSRHLLRIINDILDFAKVESGKLQLESIEIDVRDLVGSVTELMSGSASNHNLKLNASVAENLPQVVRGDPIRLRQILINLVSNAIKFTEEGGIRVEVSLGQTSQKEVELLFAVADTGVGMSPDVADRLFQSFTQADASTTRKHGGTGLGLVICKRLVELMGGKIGVRSAPGKGSTFWFLVPLRRSVMEVPSARRDLNGLRVLTLISEPEVASRVSANLRQWGVAEEVVGDPAEALSKLRSTAMLGESWMFDLVLIDSTGIEQRLPNILAEIRSIEALGRMKILVSIRSDRLAQKVKRDYGVLVLSEALRPEPMRRVLHRLFDVESQHFGNPELKPEEIYDDLNVSAVDVALDDEEPNRSASTAVYSGTVLLVEDNPVNLGVVQKALSKLGLSCETATDGSEALASFGKSSYDIVFMDCQMPVMDGYQATREIRRLEARSDREPTPIVAMTANAMAGDREKCIDAGMDDYLAKPVSLEQLRGCVEDWLGRRPLVAPKEQSPAGEPAMQDNTAEVLDDSVLRELREIMDDDYQSLLRTYLRNAPQLLDQIQDAIDRRDVEAMVIPVHSLKSSSANVGALRLSECARAAEGLARNGQLAEAEAAFQDVQFAFSDAAAALQTHLD